jgi:hypothetical protein
MASGGCEDDAVRDHDRRRAYLAIVLMWLASSVGLFVVFVLAVWFTANALLPGW